MKKFAGAMMLALSGSVAFAAETVVPAFNEGTQRNYNGKTKVTAGSDGSGAMLTVTATEATTSSVETAWTVLTDRFAVPSGSVAYVVEFEIACATDWTRVGMSKEWGSDVSWRDAKGEEVGNDPLYFRFRKGDFTAFRIGGRIPSGAVAAVVRLGTDGPNVKYGEDVRIRNFRMRFFAGGEQVPEDLHPDLTAPLVYSRFTCPTTDANVAAKYEFVDAGGIDWDSLSVCVVKTKEPVPFRREGNLVTLAPGRPWATGINTLVIRVKDTAGNETVSHKTFLIGEPTKGPQVTLRDDGVTLVDGKPFFPIGIYRVRKMEKNGNDYRTAFRELKAAGFNTVHTYDTWQMKSFQEFLDAAEEVGMKMFIPVGAENGNGGFNEKYVLAARNRKSLLAWYLADDTALHVMKRELLWRHTRCKALDPWHITMHADAAGGECGHRFGEYFDTTDVFAPEVYPVQQAKPHGREVLQALASQKVVQDTLAANGWPRKASWPIIQHFDGWAVWNRFPTEAELRAMTYASIAHGARGILFYAYTGTGWHREGRWARGVRDVPERWDEICRLAGELRSLSDALVARDAKAQPRVSVDRGEVVARLKDFGDGLLVTANATTNAVRATFGVTGVRRAVPLFEPARTLDATHGLTDDFAPYGVHVYKLEK